VKIGESDEALTHYEAAVRLKPDYANAHTNLANLLDERGRSDEAIRHFEGRSAPTNHVLARANLAIALGSPVVSISNRRHARRHPNRPQNGGVALLWR
jgi:tetratricopeptide (TPR) repeat protein